MRINTNVNAMIATNQMTKNTALSGASMEKLSTGLRITKAGDDATGLAVSEKMRSQIRGMEQADRNVQDGISMVQTAEGAMEEIGNITQRMRELAVQASNETYTADDREKITAELTELNSEIDRIAESTTFNNEKLLTHDANAKKGVSLDDAGDIAGLVEVTNFKISSDIGDIASSIKITSDGSSLTLELIDGNGDTVGSQTINTQDANFKGNVNFDRFGVSFDVNATGSGLDTIFDTNTGKENDLKAVAPNGPKTFDIQAGSNSSVADENNKLTITIETMSTESLGITEKAITDIADVDKKAGTEAANNLITTLDNALSKINSSRATLGAQQNRLEYTSSNLTTSTENLSSAESRIRDVDVAKEMVELSKLNILNQASQAMVSQAKQQPESVSQLLR